MERNLKIFYEYLYVFFKTKIKRVSKRVIEFHNDYRITRFSVEFTTIKYHTSVQCNSNVQFIFSSILIQDQFYMTISKQDHAEKTIRVQIHGS